jgi:drug/metabolite transporter (DMT)-like permease
MPIGLRLFLITTLVMIAFAANSVLGRLGLIGTDIGAGSFALIRLISGAAVLLLICTLQRKHVTGTWAGGVALLAYAAFFSYAYTALSAGMGAIILFALVQLTMLGWGLVQGERLSTLQWAGFVVAIAALIWLVSPSIEAPSLVATAAMAIAGMGWGAYSLLGRGVSDPTAATAGNFLRASALGLPILALAISFAPERLPPTDGIVIAVVSGAVTSGLGYVIWYSVVKQLSASRAGVAQLSVPAIAAIGGVLFLSEPITLRFALSTLAILGGVGLAVLTAAPGSSKASE